MYGKVVASDSYGNKVTWVWDYAKEEPRLKSEMTIEEITASEKAKWMKVKAQLDSEK
jgi:hypothetical protein